MKKVVMLTICAALIAALVGGAALMTKQEAETPIENAGAAMNAAVKPRSLTYKGQEYPMKPHLQTVLLIGTDSTEAYEEVTEGFKPYYNYNQADFLLLIVLDTDAGTAEILQINRDTITGLGVTYDGRPTAFDGCYYFPAIESMTGVHVDIDWQEDEGYSSAVAATLLMSKDGLPDILNPTGFGVMELADDGLIVALDPYLELMPNIVAAVGQEHMDAWRSADGHIYTIPSVSTIQGSFAMMVRQDWLDALGLSEPETWEDWLTYWRDVRDNDLNGNGDPHDEIPFALAQSADGERSLTLLLNAFGIAASNDTQFYLLDDGSYTMVYEHPRYPEYLEAVARLYAEGLLAEGYEDFTYASIEQAMGDNTLGSAMTFAASGAKTAALRENGDADALWRSVRPIAGPYGDRMIQERELVSPTWCITAGAADKGKVEDIIRFFDWCFSEEGAWLYNYGIEGVSFTVENGSPVLNKALVANGFTDYRAVGINYEPFGGYWLQDAYMQCLFAGKTLDDLTDIQKEMYSALQAGMNGHIAKPIVMKELLAQLEKALG